MRHYPPRAPQSPAGHWSAKRDRTEQARFRKLVLANAGHQCQHIEYALDPQLAYRCPATRDLQAHHTQPGNNDPATGLALCRPHHRQVDRYAR